MIFRILTSYNAINIIINILKMIGKLKFRKIKKLIQVKTLF